MSLAYPTSCIMVDFHLSLQYKKWGIVNNTLIDMCFPASSKKHELLSETSQISLS